MKRILLLLIPLLLVTSCAGGTKRDAEHRDAENNDADVAFVQQMIPHHQQAIMMADLVPGNDASPAVTALAAQIKAAQAPEITLMRTWLEDWNESSMNHGGDMDDMGDAGMGDGMLSGPTMRDLARAAGTEFDRLWLTGMISHHEGAIEMAQNVLKDGKSKDVAELARNIIEAQNAEISTMKGLLE